MNELRISKELVKFYRAKGKEPIVRYLISIILTFRTSLTLNIAIRLGLLKPNFRLSTMIQLYRRYYY